MRSKEERESLRQKLEEAHRELARLRSEVDRSVGRDRLTGLLEINSFINSLSSEAARAGRYGRPMSVCRIDLDGFEALNVQHGRAIGDRVLAAVAKTIATQTRAQDIICRCGSDEFALMLPETDTAGAMQCCERLTGVLERMRVEPIEGMRVSIGIAGLERGQTPERLFQAAGAALHEAREDGGGRISLAGMSGAAEYVRGDGALALMASLVERDSWTASHGRAVADMAATLAQKMGDASESDTVRTAALLHDVGKIGIPDSILNKPEALDEGEWALMRDVPLAGERIMRSVPGMGAAARLVRHVHERYDGGGYPDGLSGAQIPMGSRLIAPCDAYHAMTSPRPFRRPLSHEEAIHELIQGAASQFDPDIVEVLIGHLNGQRQAAAYLS